VDLHHAGKPFVAHPKSSTVLAVLLIVIGIAFVSGWFSDSPNRRYFPVHHWLMAGLSWLVAFFFLANAFLGFKQKNKSPSH
jgi:quinol-cytochrome oxidoreductase complex cytochrome b subunit